MWYIKIMIVIVLINKIYKKLNLFSVFKKIKKWILCFVFYYTKINILLNLKINK